MGCRATNQAKCIQTLETLDFDNNRIASRLMKIHPSCRVLILSQDPHHSVLICRFCQLFANLPYQGTPRNLHCSAAVNPGDGFAPIGGMPAAAGRNTFLHFYCVTSCFKITKSQNSTCNPQVHSSMPHGWCVDLHPATTQNLKNSDLADKPTV